MTKQVIIAVIGVTGAGKTTFISKATGRTDLNIGHDLDSCTKDIERFECRIDGRQVVLLDTPGFDDTYDSDAEILERIADYLHTIYHDNFLLSGLILLQPINTNRLTSTERKRTRLFKKIMGEDAYKRVVIGTTMWEALANSGLGRMNRDQREARDDVWGDMKNLGAEIVDHADTRESAHRIIRKILQYDDTIELQMQKELRANGNVYETSAGQQLDADLGDEISRLRRQIAGLMNDNEVTAAELRETQERLEKYEGQRRGFRKRVARAFRSCTVM